MFLRQLRRLIGRDLASRLGRDRSGAVMVTTAVMATALVGFTGLGVDVGFWFHEQHNAQRAVDAAAMAGGFELLNLPVAAANVQSVAVGDAQFSGYTNGSNATIAVTLSADRRSLDVTLATTAPLFFARLFLDAGPTINTRARAGIASPPLCVLALEPSASNALHLTGQARITAQGCLVQANSTAASAARTEGANARVTAGEICVRGTASGTGYSPAPFTGAACPPLPDPLAGLAPPPSSGCTYNNLPPITGGTRTLSPGIYCGGLSVQGTAIVTLQPGEYVIKDGPLRIAGSSTVQGNGAGFYLTGTNANVTMAGGSSFNITAPSTGPLAGIVLYRDRNAPASGVNTLTGSNRSVYNGTLYFPSQTLTFTGNGSANAPSSYTMVIARRVTAEGNGSLIMGTNYNAVPLPGGMTMRPVLME